MQDRGVVESLCKSGHETPHIEFVLGGVLGDYHSGFQTSFRKNCAPFLHDSAHRVGEKVYNWRMWSALSREELELIAQELGVTMISPGSFVENLIISGIGDFSKLPAGSRLTFPVRNFRTEGRQAILRVECSMQPCERIGILVASKLRKPKLKSAIVRASCNRRGLVGSVLSAGRVEVGDTVVVSTSPQ